MTSAIGVAKTIIAYRRVCFGRRPAISQIPIATLLVLMVSVVLRLHPLFVPSTAVPSRPSRLSRIDRSTDLLSLSLCYLSPSIHLPTMIWLSIIAMPASARPSAFLRLKFSIACTSLMRVFSSFVLQSCCCKLAVFTVDSDMYQMTSHKDRFIRKYLPVYW